MRSSVFDLPFGPVTNYQQQFYNSEEQASDEYMKTFVNSIREEVSRNQLLYRHSGKKSSSNKKSKRQPTSDDQRFPWQDRYKGKSKERQMNQKYSSQKEKLRTQQKSIGYETIFGESCYGNSTDLVSAGLIYKEILESIVVYMMEKELEMDIILAKKKPAETKKQIKEQVSKGKKSAKDQKPIKDENHKSKNETSKLETQQEAETELLLQIADSELEDSIEVPLKQKAQKAKQQNIIEEKAEKKIRPFESDEEFLQNFGKFKRCSSPNSIIGMIPYKAIPSLFLVSLLNFIISRSTQTALNKYFEAQDQHYKMYKEMNVIAQTSKKYLIEEKLMKGLTYITEVEEKLNKIYAKKGFKLKNTAKIENSLAESAKQEAFNNFEERKSSIRSEQSPITEERKQQSASIKQK